MTKPEQHFSECTVALAVSMGLSCLLSGLGYALLSENLTEIGTAFGLASLMFLGGMIYWGVQLIK